MTKIPFKLVAATFTPFDTAGQLDLRVISKYADHLKRQHVTDVFVGGTTGEAALLTTSERIQLAQAWCDVAGEEFEVIVHVGHASPHEAKHLAAHAQEVGAAAISAHAPYFFKPESVHDLVEVCAVIAESAAATPFYYYHIPSFTGVAFSMAAFVKLAQERIPTLAGVKYTCEDLMDMSRTIAVANDDIKVLFGRDEILLSALTSGVQGAVGSTYNFLAPIFYDLLQAFDTGNLDKAQQLQRQVQEIVAVAMTFGGLPALKTLLAHSGIDCGGCRLPLRTLSSTRVDELLAQLEQRDLLSVLKRSSLV